MSEFNLLENRIIKMEQQIENVSEQLKQYHADNREQHDELKALIEKIDNQKANKWVEDAMTRLNWIVILAVVGAIIALVIK